MWFKRLVLLALLATVFPLGTASAQFYVQPRGGVGSGVYIPLSGGVMTPNSTLDGNGSQLTGFWGTVNQGLAPNKVSVGTAGSAIGGSTTEWTITNPSGSTFRYTFTGTGTNPGLTASFSTSSIKTNDVVVLAAQNFNAANNGTYTVTGFGLNYFEITNASGVAEASKTIGTGSITTSSGTAKDVSLLVTQSAIVPLGTVAAPVTTNPYTLTAANAYGFILHYGATGTVNLPAGVAGMNGIIYNTGAFTITIDPNGSEIVVRDGTTQTGGVSFTLSSGAGNFVAIEYNGGCWVTLGYKGALNAGS